MLHKTKGIVFKYFKYRDTSIIAKIFTEQFGLQTYIVNGVRSKSAKGKIALYQPLTLLDLVVYHKEGKDINRISEVKCTQPFLSLPYEISKSAIGVFLAEVLYKSIKEQNEVTELFAFVYNSIKVLDHQQSNFANFHLQFMLKMSRYLGIGMDTFELPGSILDDNDMTSLSKLLNENYQAQVTIPNQTRRRLLDHILLFYKYNIDSFGVVNSVEVLREVL